VRVAVIGHVEWCQFVRVDQMPRTGEIVHTVEEWEEPGGGGSLAAVELVRLAGDCLFFTALGDDDLGRQARRELEHRGVTVHASQVREPTRRAIVHVDDVGERTITVLGKKLLPRGDDANLPWEELARTDAVYFCSGDLAALRVARKARIVVATARELGTLRRASVELDALVGSGEDEDERYHPGELDPPPKLVVTTSGALGGWAQPGGPSAGRRPSRGAARTGR
jgi:ribokinase